MKRFLALLDLGDLRTTVTSGIILRMIADACLIMVALAFALGLRFLGIVTALPASAIWPREILSNYFFAYTTSGPLLSLIAVLVFASSGFYSRGRGYRSRYKAVIIVQGVSLSFVLFTAITYLSQGFYTLPRGAMLMAWALAVALTLTSRLWSSLYRSAVTVEIASGAKEPGPERPRSVLVVGGSGYVGSALLPKLLSAGLHVRVLDTLLYGKDPMRDVLDHPELELIQADFRQVDRVVEAARNMDAVVHLGAIVGDPACALDEALTIDVNLMATRMIAEVTKGCNIQRFVFASTCSVYGAADQILDERSALRPVSLYAKSKIASERVLESISDHGFAPTILRFATMFGFSGRMRFDLVVNLLCAKAFAEGKITLFGGQQWRPFIHVDDAALAIFRVLTAPLATVGEQVFNVGTDTMNYTLAQMAEQIHAQVPTAEILEMDSDSDLRNYRVSFAKIQDCLAFRPQWTLSSGIAQVLGVLRAGTPIDYLSSRYSNVKFLSEVGPARLARLEPTWAYDLIASTEKPDK